MTLARVIWADLMDIGKSKDILKIQTGLVYIIPQKSDSTVGSQSLVQIWLHVRQCQRGYVQTHNVQLYISFLLTYVRFISFVSVRSRGLRSTRN